MNQTIQFPEREWWDDELQSVCFIALVDGFQITCAVYGEVLLRRFKDERTALGAFCHHRWILEEEAEVSILAQQENDQGWIWLS